MIDTLTFHSPLNNEIVDYTYLSETLLGAKHDIGKEDPDRFRFTGNLKNLKITIQQHGYHITGSISKYINEGNNIKPIKRTQLLEAIEEISDILGLSVLDARITRVDITDNLITDKPPIVYMPYLGDCKHLERVNYQYNGVQYINNSRHLTFYDKHKEAFINGIVIPDEYRNKNLLRYEYSISKNRDSLLGFSLNTISDLVNKDNFITMIDKWENQYYQVKKLSKMITQQIPITNRKSYRSNKMIQAYAGLTESIALEEVDYLFAIGNLKCRRELNRIKQDIHELFKFKEMTITDKDLINVLNEKVSLKAKENKDLLG